MKPLNIILDTSILSSDKKLSGSNFLLLKKLCQLDFIKLHIPWVVYKEFTSQNTLEITEDINKALKIFRSINQKGLAGAEQSELNCCYSVIKSIKDNISLSIEKYWNDFKDKSKAKIHDIENSHGNSVMNSYFNKSKPFSSLKNKSDIPDAFVYESVCSIAKAVENAIFICNDNNLRKAFEEFQNMKTYESLEQFFQSDDFKPVDTEYKNIELYADELIDLTKNIKIIHDILNERLEDFLENFINTEVESENIPSDNNDGTIVHIESFKPVTIDMDNIKFINNIFYLKALATGSVRIEYFLYKWDEYMIEDRNNADIIDNDWNDHYYQVEESYDFELTFDSFIKKEYVLQIKDMYNNGNLDFLEIDEGSASFENLKIT